jgi:hypothetical protein
MMMYDDRNYLRKFMSWKSRRAMMMTRKVLSYRKYREYYNEYREYENIVQGKVSRS